MFAGIDPGRWVAEQGLGPGASYQVTSYSPHPSAAQLATPAALTHGRRWPRILSLTIPIRDSLQEQYPEAIFGPFHAPTRTRLQQGRRAGARTQHRQIDGGLAVRGRLPSSPSASPPSQRRRTRSSRTCCATSRHGYTYNQNPPLTDYPTRDLPVQRQDVATASSSPARWRCCCGWAASRHASRPGSRPGTFDRATGQYVRRPTSTRMRGSRCGSRTTAGSRFDPTPAVAPARGGGRSTLSVSAGRSTAGTRRRLADPGQHRGNGHDAATTSTARLGRARPLAAARAPCWRSWWCSAWWRCAPDRRTRSGRAAGGARAGARPHGRPVCGRSRRSPRSSSASVLAGRGRLHPRAATGPLRAARAEQPTADAAPRAAGSAARRARAGRGVAVAVGAPAASRRPACTRKRRRARAGI